MTHIIVEDILIKYNETLSVKATAKACKCSWQRAIKILSSNGVMVNDIHGLILKLHKDGKTVSEISEQTGYSPKVIQAYLPAVRPYYNVNPSDNAKRIRKSRQRKGQNHD